MKIAYILFDRITWFDFIGIYDPASRVKSLNYLPDLTWDICSYSTLTADTFGLQVKADKIQNSLDEYDALIIPGGFGTRKLPYDNGFINWIKTGETTSYKISLCTGSLILGAAGFLKRTKATTNYREYETLKPYCKEVLQDRIVEDGKVITAGTVSASIDLGLYLCKNWAGEETQNEIRKRIGYNG
jgi:transcriptional regulator GlxA family with amidase domain